MIPSETKLYFKGNCEVKDNFKELSEQVICSPSVILL